jgi:hypothetical protein
MKSEGRSSFRKLQLLTYSRKILRLLRNPKFCYRVYKSLPLVPILKYSNPVHILSLTSILILLYHSLLGYPSGLFPSVYPAEIVHVIISTFRAACPALLNVLDLITLIRVIINGLHALKIDIKKVGWTIGVLGFDFRRGLGIFLFTTVSRTALGPTQPPMQWVPGALSLGVKRPEREADHSPPSSAEVKNAWSYTSTPPIRRHGVVLS